MTNLNNYVNLRSGSTTAQWLGHDTELVPFGAGSGFLGIPGDVTPPSRFVRAAFYQSSAPRQDSALQTVRNVSGFWAVSRFLSVLSFLPESPLRTFLVLHSGPQRQI